ncbi:hypothetical protein CCMA1212_004293 [Trichoderma ghanense]|uniref:Uncharacterized protein n=1 Tax=Trichoderma ghanense TaxID=65468 RepID=A0ABY2H6Q7_9HYPO
MVFYFLPSLHHSIQLISAFSFGPCIYHSHTQRRGLALTCCTLDCGGRWPNTGS